MILSYISQSAFLFLHRTQRESLKFYESQKLNSENDSVSCPEGFEPLMLKDPPCLIDDYSAVASLCRIVTYWYKMVGAQRGLCSFHRSPKPDVFTVDVLDR